MGSVGVQEGDRGARRERRREGTGSLGSVVETLVPQEDREDVASLWVVG